MTVRDSAWREREIAGRRALLRRRGVPEPFIEAIASRDDNASTFGGGVVVIVPLLALLGLYWWGFEAYVAHRTAQVVSLGHAAQGWVYGPTGWVGWVGALVLLLSGIAAVGWLHARVAYKVPPWPGPSLAASVLRTPAGEHMAAALADVLSRRLLRDAFQAPSADALLERFGRRQTRGWAIFTLATAVPAAAAIAVGDDGWWALGPKGGVLHQYGMTHAVAWADARSVTLGCNETKDTHDLKYEVAFPGWTQDLGNDGDTLGGKTMAERDRIAGVLRADAQLRAQKTPRLRWSWLDKDPMHPACLAYWRAVADTVEPGSLDRLLSLAP
jgi:hypothetical protein